MTHRGAGRKTIEIVGKTLVILGIAGFLVSRLAIGRLFWLNAYSQPVSVFLVIPTLAIFAVIGLLNLFVWRRQRQAPRIQPPHDHRSKHRR